MRYWITATGKMRLILLLIITFSFSSAGQELPHISLSQENEHALTLTWKLPEHLKTNNLWQILPALGYSEIRFTNQPPQLALMVPLSQKLTQQAVTILSVKESAQPIAIPPTFIDSSNIAVDDVPAVAVRQLGSVAGNPLTAIYIYPFKKCGENQAILREEIRVRIQLAEPLQLSDHPEPKLIQLLKSKKNNRIRKNLAKQNAPHRAQIKITVSEDGLYRISYSELATLATNLPTKINIDDLRLTSKGKQVPFYIDGGGDQEFEQGDYLEFFGEFSRAEANPAAPDLYLDEYATNNIYWLEWGQGKGRQLVDEDVVVHESNSAHFQRVSNYLYTKHIEYDFSYNRLSNHQSDVPRDHWFMSGTLFSGQKRDWHVDLPTPDVTSELPVRIRAMLHGYTQIADQVHNAEIFINNFKANQVEWVGQELKDVHPTAAYDVNGRALRKQLNQISVINQSEGSEFNGILINWFEITYPRLLEAENGYIEFTIPPNRPAGLFDFRVDGFTSNRISIYKRGVSKLVGYTIEFNEDIDGNRTYSMHFQDEVLNANTNYFAVEESAKKSPLNIEAPEFVDLRDISIAGDYVAIVPDTLYESRALNRLLAYRRDQGYQITKINAKHIYNQFSQGFKKPHGIKAFLKHAYDFWQTSPQYVLLVGDGNYDYRKLRSDSTTQNLIPIYRRQVVKYGATTSDHWYTLLDGDDELPDIFLGRLPINTEEELAVLVDKIIRSETEVERDDWLNRFLLLGGNGGEFRHQTEELIEKYLPTRVQTQKLFTQPATANDPFLGTTEDLLNYWSQGALVVNFMGHGGGAIWADASLLNLESAHNLQNYGRFPFVTSMTCFTGAFDEPNRRTLAEELLTLPDAGTMGVWASTGFGWVENDYLIVRELYKLIAEYGNGLTIGEYLTAAKIQYFSNNLNQQVFAILNQYLLLGDPAMRLQLPSSEINLNLDNELYVRGDSIHVQAELQIEQGEARIELLDHHKEVIAQNIVLAKNNTAKTSFVIPEQLASDFGYLRLYARNDQKSTHFSTAKPLFFSGVIIDSVGIASENPYLDQPFHIVARVRHAEPVASVFAVVNHAGSDTLNMKYDPNQQHYKTERALPPQARNTRINASVFVEDQNGNAIHSQMREYRVPFGPDLRVLEKYIELDEAQHARLKMRVYNLGDLDAEQVQVKFEVMSDQNNWRIFAFDTVDVAQKQFATRMVEVPRDAGEMAFRLTVDPDNQIWETDEHNNTVTKILRFNHFAITPEWGTTTTADRADTIRFDANLQFFVPAGQVASTMFLRVSPAASITMPHQPDFSPVPTANGTMAYRFTFLDSSGAQQVENARVKLQTEADSSNAVFCIFQEKSRRWVKLAPVENGFQNIMLPAQIAMMEISDHSSPEVEINIAGQLFADGGFVGKRPLISVLAQDENGIDVAPRAVQLFVDGMAWPFENIAILDSTEGANTTVFHIKPEFFPGIHSFSASIRDAAGNATNTREFQFQVSDKQELVFLGNYPNPFRQQTTFAFKLTDQAEDLYLKIYTASGRLIRTIEAMDIMDDPNPLGPNYHEINWDARDEYGERVANGMYFYKLAVKFSNRNVEKIGRIVRLR